MARDGAFSAQEIGLIFDLADTDRNGKIFYMSIELTPWGVYPSSWKKHLSFVTKIQATDVM
jgi:hypothetical protein